MRPGRTIAHLRVYAALRRAARSLAGLCRPVTDGAVARACAALRRAARSLAGLCRPAMGGTVARGAALFDWRRGRSWVCAALRRAARSLVCLRLRRAAL